MNSGYIDREGRVHALQATSLRRPRSGIFAICIYDNKILLSWPRCAADVAELPGGGIEQGESLEQALIRELEEEAAVHAKALSPVEEFKQEAKFYAEFDDEFWDYNQTYWRIDERQAKALYFEGARAPDDALKSEWITLDDAKTLKIHAVHARVLTEVIAL